MTSKEAFKKILKLIVSGKIPKELYNEYLGDTEIGFMSFEELETYFSEPQPTLSECIKEWEDLGYELTRRERRFISFQNKEDSTFIVMTWYSEFKYEKHNRGTSTSINLKEHNLIYKTMKLFEIELGG